MGCCRKFGRKVQLDEFQLYVRDYVTEDAFEIRKCKTARSKCKLRV